MNVVSLAEFRNRELVAVCRDLLDLFERGDGQGLAFVVKIGRKTHRPGLAGDYTSDPDEALVAAGLLWRRLLRDSASETGTQ